MALAFMMPSRLAAQDSRVPVPRERLWSIPSDGIARPDVTDRLGRFERDPSGSYNIYDRNGERIKARSLRRAQARSVRVVDAVFRLGCFAYIPKPVDYVSLEHLVAMACRSI